MSRFLDENSAGRHRQKSWQRWLPIVAGVVLIGFWVSILLSGQNYSNAAIIQNHFIEPSSHIESGMSDNLDQEDENYLKSQFLVGADHFKNKNYPKAIETYENILSNSPKSKYNIEEEEMSIAVVNKLLCYLAMGDMEKVKTNLEFFSNPAITGMPKDVATEIKTKINSFWYGWAN